MGSQIIETRGLNLNLQAYLTIDHLRQIEDYNYTFRLGNKNHKLA